MSTAQSSNALSASSADAPVASTGSTALSNASSASSADAPVASTGSTALSNASSTSSADTPVANTASNTLQETAANAEGSRSANDSETSEDQPIQSHTPSKHKAEVLRIRRWPEWAYYKILNVEENVSQDDIKRAWFKRSKLSHPDRNNDFQAVDASQRVNKAYEILSDERLRRNYDLELKRHKDRGELIENDTGEEYAENAYTNNEDDGNNDESSEENDEQPQPMSSDKEELLSKMQPWVKRMFESRDNKEAYKKLEELKNDMRTLNRSENLSELDHNPPLIPIKKRSKRFHDQIDKLRESNLDAREKEELMYKIESERDGFADLLRDLELPLEWLYDKPNLTAPPAGSRQSSARDRQTGNQSTSSRQSSARDRQTGNQSTSSRQSSARDRQTGNQSTSSRQSSARDRQTSNPSAAASSSTEQSPSDAMDFIGTYTPGKTTERGERILAYRPFIARGINEATGLPAGVVRRGQLRFVIEKGGQPNQIAIATLSQVGFDAAMAYIRLPNEQKNDISNINKNYDKMAGWKLNEIVDVARDSGDPQSKIRPYTVVLVKIDGKLQLINRSTLEYITTAKEADKLIDDCLIKKGEKADPRRSDRRLLGSREPLQIGQGYSNGQSGNSRAYNREGPPRRLGYQESYNMDLHTYSRPDRGRRAGGGVHFHDTRSRRNLRHDEDTDMESDGSLEPGNRTNRGNLRHYQDTGMESDGPYRHPRYPKARPVQPVERTSTNDTPLDMTSDNLHSTSTATRNEFITQADLNATVNAAVGTALERMEADFNAKMDLMLGRMDQLTLVHGTGRTT